jgi:hypothetical protein
MFTMVAQNTRKTISAAAAVRPVVVAGPGRTIGAIETLTGIPLARRAVVSREGRSLRLDRQDLFDVLSDHVDLLQGVFASVLDSGRSGTSP